MQVGFNFSTEIVYNLSIELPLSIVLWYEAALSVTWFQHWEKKYLLGAQIIK